MDELTKFVVFIVAVVGCLTIAQWINDARELLPAPGVECVTVTYSTSAGRRRTDRCEPVAGWHMEAWPGHREPVPVPDRAQIVRR